MTPAIATRFCRLRSPLTIWMRAFGDVQGVGEEGDQGVVGGAFDRRGGDADHQRVVAGAGAFGFSGAGNDADVDLDARSGLTNQGTP